MIIAPSLLAANFSRLDRELVRVNASEADWLHLDIMDGHFVPNISFGPALVKSIRPLSRVFFDAHLMCSQPEILLEPFSDAGVDQLSIHVELGDRVRPLLWKIKSLRRRVGLVVNPPTPIALVKSYLREINFLLIMTVNPGFGGQSFIFETLPKIQQARAWREQMKLDFHIGVDGGIDSHTAAECARVGADAFISGTSLFKSANLKAAVSRMRRAVESCHYGSGRQCKAEVVNGTN